ncbi:hypothetical protein M3621_13850 [Bacillus safensis]|uniref:hypothetical protein n=1 Tax=Bacillus safensis TaxID=561879 RepID=UPI00203F3F40|nr:hypothetical protein [Bacillus safensis]MCM3367884.1 hypothetical protein [Bacillus safensis]
MRSMHTFSSWQLAQNIMMHEFIAQNTDLLDRFPLWLQQNRSIKEFEFLSQGEVNKMIKLFDPAADVEIDKTLQFI